MKQRLRRRLRALQRHPGSSRGARRGPGSRKRSFRGRKHPQAKAARQAPVRSCCPPAGHRGSPAERERALAQAREAGARQPLWASPHGPMGPTAEHASTRQHTPAPACLCSAGSSAPILTAAGASQPSLPSLRRSRLSVAEARPHARSPHVPPRLHVTAFFAPPALCRISPPPPAVSKSSVL